MWRPYGFVLREGGRIALFQVRGATAFSEIRPDAGAFVVETWFGPGAADFRVASLHAFDLALDAESSLPSVRFV